MTMTDRPIPADLAFPGGDEPLSPDDLRALEELADRAGTLTVEDLLAAVLETAEAESEEDRVRSAVSIGLDLAGADDPEHPLASLTRVARWRVEDDGGAEWAARKLAAVKAEQDEAEELAAQWRAEIDRWLTERRRPLAKRYGFFEGLLLDYLRRRMEADPKLRTITLPSATLKGSVAKPKVGLAEEEAALEALIAWADEHLDADDLAAVVKTTRKPMVSELRKVASVASVHVGDRLNIALECGHELSLFRPDGKVEPETPAPEVDHLPCAVCEPDPIDGPAVRAVVAVEVVEVHEPVVRDNDSGAIIPGAVVTPEATTYNVKVGG